MRYKNQSSPGDVVIAGTGVITPIDLARRMGVVINDYDETLTTPQKRERMKDNNTLNKHVVAGKSRS